MLQLNRLSTTKTTLELATEYRIQQKIYNNSLRQPKLSVRYQLFLLLAEYIASIRLTYSISKFIWINSLIGLHLRQIKQITPDGVEKKTTRSKRFTRIKGNWPWKSIMEGIFVFTSQFAFRLSRTISPNVHYYHSTLLSITRFTTRHRKRYKI